MKEEFLHFIWATKSYYAEGWQTVAGEAVEVLHPGFLNQNQGPDFLNAKVKVNEIECHGHVEIHVDSRDWYRHGHQNDRHYNAVILHVVLRHQPLVLRKDGTPIPEVSLDARIHAGLFANAARFDYSSERFPCQNLLKKIPSDLSQAWLEKLGGNRQRKKIDTLAQRLQATSGDWEQVLWEACAAAFGGPVNQDAFRRIAEGLPYRKLKRYLHSDFQREALLFGAACALTGQAKDPYHQQLQEEWRFLSQLHQIHPAPVLLRFHRMRPASFPTLRLSLLGSLAARHPVLTDLLGLTALKSFKSDPLPPISYWQFHLHFGKLKPKPNPGLGQKFRHVFLLNSLLPLAMMYAEEHGHQELKFRIQAWGNQLPPEDNRLIRPFKKAGLLPQNACESQGLIELQKSYCWNKRCLECEIGQWIVKKLKQ